MTQPHYIAIDPAALDQPCHADILLDLANREDT